jgi:hypothetical protein
MPTVSSHSYNSGLPIQFLCTHIHQPSDVQQGLTSCSGSGGQFLLLEGLRPKSRGVGRESFRCSTHGRICTSHLRMTLSSYPLSEAHRLHQGPLSNVDVDPSTVLKARRECYAGCQMKTSNNQHQWRKSKSAAGTQRRSEQSALQKKSPATALREYSHSSLSASHGVASTSAHRGQHSAPASVKSTANYCK